MAGHYTSIHRNEVNKKVVLYLAEAFPYSHHVTIKGQNVIVWQKKEQEHHILTVWAHLAETPRESDQKVCIPRFTKHCDSVSK